MQDSFFHTNYSPFLMIRKDLASTNSSDDGRSLSCSYLETRNVILSDSVKQN